MTMLTAQQFYDLLESYGLEMRRYSDQGISGPECPGFVTDKPYATIAYLVFRLNRDETEDMRQQIVPFLHDGQCKSYGSRTLVYFPTLRFPKE